MKFSVKRMILRILAITFFASFLIVFVLEEFFAVSFSGSAIYVAFAIVIIAEYVLSLIWLRCPHCNSHLNDLSNHAIYCPYCSKELE